MRWSVLVAGLALLTVAAATVSPLVHMGVTALASLILAAAAVRGSRFAAANGDSTNVRTAEDARAMAAVWLWGAASLLPPYLWFVTWPEWWKFFLALASVGLVCLFFSHLLAADAQKGREDRIILTLARRLAIAQLVGTVIAMAGLIIDGKMTRFLNIRKGWEDWAANNIFFFGALALALISAHALMTTPLPGQEAKPDAPSAG